MQENKILFISNIFPPHVRGGYELGCLELAEKYGELGFKVVVATSENTPDLQRYPDPKHIDVRRIFTPVKYYDDKHNFHFQGNPIYFYEKLMAFAGYIEHNCIALRRLIEIEQPNLVWIFNPLGIGPIGILDTVLSCNVKVLIHLMENIDGVIEENSRIINLTSKWKQLKSQVTAISCSKKIFASSQYLGRYNSNTIIYNWVKLYESYNYLENIVSTDPKKTIKSLKHKGKQDKFRLVYFGQIAEKKGVGILYNLAKYIAKSPYKDKITIDLFGRGEKDFVNWLEKQITQDQNLTDIFVLNGFISKDNLLEKIGHYDMAVFPLSDDEPFGYAPIEAMLTGVPVMITSKTGASEILKDRHDVIYIKDRNNTRQFYQKLIWCLENPDILDLIRSNAITTIKLNCDLEHITLPAINQVIDSITPSKGYPFEYVLASCEHLKYPYFELDVKNYLSGARYKFIDKAVDISYRLPIINKFLRHFVKHLLQYRRNKL
ncbi:glycosyltransferase family 4 protein [Nostoc sp.]